MHKMQGIPKINMGFECEMEPFLEVKHIKHPHYSLLVQSNNIGKLPTLTPIPARAWHMHWQIDDGCHY